jgi:hypothetical protein
MRPLLLAVATGALAVLVGCGGGASPAPPSVRLGITAPGDGGVVRGASVEVRGTVRPAGADVTVRGKAAEVDGTTFRARVALDPGVNVIDVLAGAGDARPALTAIRVRRVLTTSVPDVVGLAPDEARSRLEGAGLKVDAQQSGGGILDEILGRRLQVCDTAPAAGEQVDAGGTVVVTEARRCP